MIQRYLYDGTPDGLLSAIAWILAKKLDIEKLVLLEREETLFEEGLYISSDAARAEQLFARLRKHAPDAAHTLYLFLLAEKEGMESKLLHYIALAFVYGDSVSGYLTHPAIHDIIGNAKKVTRELHRMKGLLRFEQLHDGTYLAKMEPDHNIIYPLSIHFCSRLRAQDWFIVDLKRHSVARWSNGELHFGMVEQFMAPELSDDEKQVQALWKTFFKTIAIQERKNVRLQKSCMPMKYWKYLMEMAE